MLGIASVLFALVIASHANIQLGVPDQGPPGYSEWISPIIVPSKPAVGASDWASAVAKAQQFVKGLTLDEKVNITTGIGTSGTCVGNTGTIPRLNFPGFCLQDSPLGVRFTDYVSAFPAAINVATTFDKTLMYNRGAAMGSEHRTKGVNVQLGPMTNMGRVAAGGRNWEGFGADPFLSGIGTSQTVSGIQDQGVIACVKHFVGNEQEHFRGGGGSQGYSSNIDDRTMHEIYAWPFAAGIQAGAGSVMCAYNRVNQTFSCENSKILNGILKNELDFQGFVVSDWTALNSGVNSALAGTDMNMPGFFFYGGNQNLPDPANATNGWWGAQLVTAVQNGSVPEARLDDMVTRTFAAYYKMGQNSASYPKVNFNYQTQDTDVNGVQANFHVNAQDDHAQLIRQIGGASAVLLKNVDNALPLNVKKHRRYAIFGNDAGPNPDGPNGCSDRGCDQGTLAMGWGSGTAQFPYLVDPASAITSFVRSQNTGTLVEAVLDEFNTAQITGLAQLADVCLVFSNADSGEGYITVDGNAGDRNNLTLWNSGENLIIETANLCSNTIVVLHIVGPIIMESWIEHPNVTAVINAGLPGQESGNALVDVLFGAVNPSGRLPYTIAKNRSDYPADVLYETNVQNNLAPQITYSEALNIDYRHFDSANIAPRFEFGFGMSYTSFTYSGLSIQTSHPKSKRSSALASINPPAPSSKGATSATASSSAPSTSSTGAPASSNSTTNSTAPAGGNSTNTTVPATPFPPNFPPGGPADLWETALTVSFHVKNTGDVDGHEVSQVYLGFPAAAGEPPKVLRGFERTWIKEHSTESVTIELTLKDISFWDVVSQAWVVPTGQFSVFIGASSRDIRLTGHFTW